MTAKIEDRRSDRYTYKHHCVWLASVGFKFGLVQQKMTGPPFAFKTSVNFSVWSKSLRSLHDPVGEDVTHESLRFCRKHTVCVVKHQDFWTSCLSHDIIN